MISSNLSGKKVHHTALCIIPPEELFHPFQKIRKLYDSAYYRWMPHINLMFPCVPPEEFNTCRQILMDKLANFKAFELEFSELGYFSQKKRAVMWASPKSTNDNVNKLEKTIIEAMPSYNDLWHKNPEGVFKAHLTLGQFDMADIQNKLKEFSQNWKPVKFIVDKIYLIRRDTQTDPFYISHTIPLNSGASYQQTSIETYFVKPEPTQHEGPGEGALNDEVML